MTGTNKLERLQEIFALAKVQRLCRNQKEFADLVGVHPSTLSLALKGEEKHLTDKLVNNIERWAQITGLFDAPVQSADIVIPAATAKMYADMAESIRILSELVASQQGQKGEGAAVSNG